MFLIVLFVIGITAEGATGALAAGRERMDLFGVAIIACVTAIGGGSVRDVLLGNYPLVWVENPMYLVFVLVAAFITVAIPVMMTYFHWVFLILDAEDAAQYRELLALNALLPAQLAESRLPIIQISTDYVFDGKQGTPYREEDIPHPQSLYGRTKRQGELALLMHPVHPAEQHLVIRTQWLWAPWGHNFVRTMLRLAREGKSLRVVNDQIGSPTSAPSLARAICDIIACYDAERTFRTSLLHYANRGACSWYDLAYAAISTHLPEYDLSQLTPISTAEYPTAAERPAYSVLATDRVTQLYDIIPPRWQDELKRSIE